MEIPRVLSGKALVAKGITKIDASLPEVGLKDVEPSGSWLEQKQIQASLEARKYLIEVERIEKCGTLSHAKWRDDLMLAEVTQKVGGHWQYLGHNVGKTLYLKPEETLFLMEVNCLLLKHNEVTVSLQKAYSLLLHSSTSMIQYKVYASLSRLGYKVFRHKGLDENKEKNTSSPKLSREHDLKNVDSPTVSTDIKLQNVNSTTFDTNKYIDAQTLGTRNNSEDLYPPIALTSHIITANVNDSESVDSTIVNKVVELENVESPRLSTEYKLENVNSTTVDSNKSIDAQTPGTGNKSEDLYPPIPLTLPITTANLNDSESVDSQIDRKVVELGNVDSPIGKHDHTIVSTISDSNIGDSLIVHPVIECKDVTTTNNIKVLENDSSLIESQTTKLSEINEQEELEYNKTIGNIAEMSDSKDMSKCDNSVAKENESPNIMEVDETETVVIKNANNESETMQVVSSTLIESMKNNENKIDSMEICTENQEATGIAAMEEDDGNKDSNCATASTATSLITSDVLVDSGISMEEVDEDTDKDSRNVVTDADMDSDNQHIEDKCLEDLSNTKKESDSNYCTVETLKDHQCTDNHSVYNYYTKIEKITKRQLKPSDPKSIERLFENIPDFTKDRVVTINVPEQQFIPTNIFVNNTNYLLDLQNIKKRSSRSASSETVPYTSSDEVNGANIRRIRSSSSTEYPNNSNFFPQARFTRYNHFRPYGFWRPQNSINFYQLMFFQTRVQFQQRPHPLLRSSYNFNANNANVSNNARKRIRSGRTAHFQGIKNLVVRLKQALISGNTDMRNLEALHSLLHSYNLRYKSRLRLTENFDVINEEKIVETIELDDDEESKSKKPRLEQDDSDNFDENLCRLKQLALRLRDLEAKDRATASHRRAFSKAIKTFNKSYNADVYLDNNNYQIVDRRCITLDSSSESDCIVEEEPQVCKGKGKRLRNPFNILKRRSERLQSLNNPGTSKGGIALDISKAKGIRAEADDDVNKYSKLLVKSFNENWLPKESDFGRAEIVPKRSMNARLELSSKEQYIYEFMKEQFQQYENWLEAKLSFLRDLEETNIAFKNEQARILADSELCNTGLKPLINFEDSLDMPSVLERLRIVKNNKDIDTESSLIIDFDVYNRDVQNFRKRNPPKPHFRIVCIDESSGFPTAAHVRALHLKYEDNVAIVFAIVGIASVSYLQINPIDLPVYVPSNDVI